MSEKEQDFSQRGTHGGPKQQRKIRGLVQKSTDPEEHPGRKIRKARQRRDERRKGHEGLKGSGHRAPGSLKVR